MKRTGLRVAIALALILSFSSVGAFAASVWKPKRPINIIVPWNPGGASDLTARTVAAEMEKPLGSRITITNMPGGSGAIGTKAMFDAERDGHTWSGNATGSIVTYQVLEFLDVSHRDYASFLAVFTPNVICVPAASPIKDFPSLLSTMKTKILSVASAGTGSGGHQAAEFFKAYAKVDYKHVPYQGGAPAVTATVRGECDVVMQLSMEVTEMLRAKTLRAIAVMDSEPLEVEGYGVIPPITNWIPNHPTSGSYFGLFLPKNIPADALEAITDAFKVAASSQTMQKFARDRGSKAVCIYGAEAEKANETAASLISWMLYDAGIAKKSPADFGIPRLAN
ncbi:MAG: tripartite tricarboxylate transporter substrate binding protein [Firmicutes bacterium]|jgi:tripartite-type tricarboxylate transporter receptor subunit TctC|nr:tripartite tricarboxylate transporter substrate binding protein [Bacillota bacterium]